MVGLYFFLILFGGFEFVRTFAAKNDGTITCRLERVQASVVTAFFFCYINFMLFSVCHFAFELYFYTVPRCFVNGEITWRHGGCLMGLNRDWTGFEQGLFNGCSMVVQWLSPFVVVVGVGGGHECGCGFCFISHEFWQVGCDCSFGDSFEPANSTFVAFHSD